jgi:hypothetical protein
MRSHLLSVRDEFAKYIEEWLLEINEGGNGVDAERDLNALRRT